MQRLNHLAQTPAGGGERSRAASPAMAPPSPDKQREMIDEIVRKNTKLIEGSDWYVLSWKWWQAWKDYVGYNSALVRDADVAELSLEESGDVAPPGPIDNSELKRRRGELKGNLSEDYDFKLLPQRAYEHLESWYGGGPRFKRTVITVANSKEKKVELYPIRFLVYRCRADGTPDPSSREIRLLSRSKTMSQVQATLLSREGVSAANARLSWKMVSGPEDEEEQESERRGTKRPPTADTEDQAAPEAMDLDLKPGTASANASASAEDSEAEWRVVETANMSRTLDELLQDMQGPTHLSVGLLVETRPSKEDPFPRQHIMDRWRHKLKPGDLIDALDADGKWFESVVVDGSEKEDKSITDGEIWVHYKSWSSKWDERLDRMSPRVQRLHTHTTSWREDLTIDDQVELHNPADSKWYLGKVLKLDNATDRLLVGEIAAKPKLEPAWVDRDSDLIARMGTHMEHLKTKGSQHDLLDGPSSSRESSWYVHRPSTKGSPPVEGAVGLTNLGNTCFMNSMLQCLSNTQPLTEYFLEHRHDQDINADNPLGMGGKVAMSYAHLMAQLWSDSFVVVVPSQFKKSIGQFAPQFAGYQQQDSQELMSFLLDGLHEDLNRVRKKPYLEEVESDGRPDSVVAEDTWKRFLLRNDSIVVDHFYGLLRSHLTCPSCQHVSIKFDPYSSLSLPLPVESTRKLDVYFWPLPYGSRSVRVCMTVPAAARVADMKRWLVQNITDRRLSESRLVCKEVWAKKFFKVWTDEQAVMDIKADDYIVFWETEQRPLLLTRQSSGRALGGAPLGAPQGGAPPRGISQGPVQEASQGAGQGEKDWVLLGKPSGEGKEAAMDTEEEKTGPAEEPEPDPVGHPLDILFAKPAGSGIMQIGTRSELFGLPHTITYREGSTNRDIHHVVRKLVTRFLRGEEGADSMDTEDPSAEGGGPASPKRPYRVLITDSSGATSRHKGEVPEDDEAFGPLGASDALTVEFSKEGRALLDLEEVEATDAHLSVEKTADVSRKIALDQCFQKFIEREQLGDDNPFYCSNCKAHVQAFKKIDLWSTPDILIVHLKRFQYLSGAYSINRQKIDEPVDFPIEGLDLTSLLQSVGAPLFEGAPPVYDLFAVSEHSGTIRGGHYTAVARNFRNGKWYDFNDTIVSDTTPQAAQTPQAYVLFYRRRQGFLRWGGLTGDDMLHDE